MQREIELLLLAMKQRQERQAAFLESVMTSIAKASDAQSEMIAGIAAAVQDHERATGEDDRGRAALEGEIKNVIHYIRTKAS